MQKPPILRVVLRSSRSNLKVIWTYGQQTWAYKISRENVKSTSAKSRIALQQLVEVVDSGKSQDDYKDQLRSLARAGMDLYYAIMTGVSGTDEMATEFEAWFREKTAKSDQKFRIDVIFDGEALAPWGLVFSPIPDGDLARSGGSPKEYENFWCMAHRLSCYPESQIVEDGEEPPIVDGQVTELFVALDGGLRDQTDPYLATYTVTSRERMEYRSKHAFNFHQLIYVNLPTSDGELIIGAERMPPDVFKSMGHFIQHYSIIIVDRTAVIYGPNGKKWIEAFHNKWDGFIGVEADIPDNEYMKLFGLRLVKDLVSCATKFEDAVSKIRVRHWPASLAFGLYCNPSRLFISPSPDFLADVDELLTNIYADYAVDGLEASD